MTGGAQSVQAATESATRASNIRSAPPSDIKNPRTISLHGTRVLLITTSFPLRPTATSAPFVQKLAEHLGQRTELTVLTPADSSPTQAAADTHYQLISFRYAPSRWQRLAQAPGGIPVALTRYPLLHLLLPVMLASMFITAIRLARDADLIHANWSAVGLIAGLAGKLTGTPVVTTLRGSDVHWLDRWRLSWKILQWCIQLSDGVACVSEHMMRTVALQYPWAKSRLRVIPNGVDNSFLHITTADKKSSSDPLRLLCVGNLIQGKKVDTIIRAVSHASDVATHLTIVGDGPERRALKSLADQLGIGDRIHFAGQQLPHVMPELLKDTDIFILASQSEGRSNALVEAMAAGLAIISSDIPGVSELIRDSDNGLLFPVGDIEALATALRRLGKDDSLRARLGENARETIISQGFTWDRCADRYIELYAEILGRQPVQR